MIQWTWLVYTSLWVVAVGSSIRVNELTGLDPSQGDQNSIGILNTIFTNNVGPTTTRGLLIDAGSGGSRLHVYEWQPRVFKQVPPPISYPTTNEAYTGRISNGVQLCWRENQTEEDLLENLTNHLAPLLDFARSALTDQGMQDQFATIPIWFKATGGARELSPSGRNQLMNGIRKLLSDKSLCPFYFHESMARIISGEEEAVFSWACMNFLFGNLIPESEGLGTVTGNNISQSFGTIDLGGASTQIAFYLPSEDLMEGLYKLQIGGQKHWNVYTKSFLKFGLNSARRRHFEYLAMEHLRRMGITGDHAIIAHIAEEKQVSGNYMVEVDNPCFHQGFSEVAFGLNAVTSPKYASSSLLDLSMKTSGTASGKPYTLREDDTYSYDLSRFQKCREALIPLMEKDKDDYCDEAYHGECSIGGQYQPAIPRIQHFMGTSSYKVPWAILRLPQNASLELLRERAIQVCSLDYGQVQQYSKDYNISAREEKYYCFSAVYALVLLEDGYGFWPNASVTVVDTVRGNKVGWPLGAILHEINNLPWELEDPFNRTPWGKYVLSALVGVILGAVAAFSISKELHLDEHDARAGAAERGSGVVADAESVRGSPRGSGRKDIAESDNNIAGGAGASYQHMAGPAGTRGRTDTGVQMILTNYGGTPSRTEVRSDASGSPAGNWQERISQYVPLFGGSPGNRGGKSSSSGSGGYSAVSGNDADA